MLLLNIGLLSLALSLDIDKDKWLMTYVLLGATPMKTIRATISEYYLELPKSIDDLQRQWIGLQNNAPVTKNATALPSLTEAESDEEENDGDVPPLLL